MTKPKLGRVSCPWCDFPNVIPEHPNSSFGRLAMGGTTSVEGLKNHVIKHHGTKYRELLQELENYEIVSW